MRIEHRTIGGYVVVAEDSDVCYLSAGSQREVPVGQDRSKAVSVAQMLQVAVDAERAERLASYR